MNSTARRVPRITGLPARTSGSTTMRPESGMLTVYRPNTEFGAILSGARRLGLRKLDDHICACALAPHTGRS